MYFGTAKNWTKELGLVLELSFLESLVLEFSSFKSLMFELSFLESLESLFVSLEFSFHVTVT